MSSKASPTQNDPLFGNDASDLLRDAVESPTQPPSDPRFWEPPAPEELQERLVGYVVEAYLARGGMGAVYRGIQTSLERPVAIKILPPQLGLHDPAFLQRFKQEALAMAQLNHPGIVKVYDFGEMSDGTLYFIMEFINGTDVGQMVARQGRLSSAHALAVTAHVCDALQYAHESGIVHRDIKPANIMVGIDGRVKVADFGLAKSFQSSHTSLTVTGHVMGTLHFVAPEALTLGSSVDHRADIYAMGVMLYQMLTGKLPQGVFDLPSLLVPGLDPRFDQIIVSAMREDRSTRYQAILDMRRALDAILIKPVERSEAAKQIASPARTAPAKPAAPSAPKPPPGQHYYQPPKAAKPATVTKAKSSAGTWLVATMMVLGLAGFVWIKWPFFIVERPPTAQQSPQPVAEPRDTQASQRSAPETIGATPPKLPTAAATTDLSYRELLSQHQAEARTAIDEAKKQLAGLAPGEPRSTVLARLAASLALLGDFSEAEATVPQIKESLIKAQAWNSVAEAHIHFQDHAGALRCVQRIQGETLVKRRSLARMLQAHLQSGGQQGITDVLREIASMPSGHASSLIVIGDALLHLEEKSLAVELLSIAYSLGNRLPAGPDREQIMRQLATVFPRAGQMDRALAAAGKIRVDPRGAPQGHTATTLAEMDDLPNAVKVALGIPSAWARGWTFTNIAKVLQARSRQREATEMAGRIPYADQKFQCHVHLARMAGDAPRAKQALEDIKGDKHNLQEASQLYRESAPLAAATIASAEGVTAARQWLEGLNLDAATKALCWLSIATHWAPQRKVLPSKPMMQLNDLRNLAQAELSAAKGTPIE